MIPNVGGGRNVREQTVTWMYKLATIMKLTLLLFLTLALNALGNAKVSGEFVLEMERIEAAIQGEQAFVHGTFRFRRAVNLSRSTGGEEVIYFPLIRPRDAASVTNDFQLVLKLNGKEATSYVLASNAPLAVPGSDAYAVTWLKASYPKAQLRQWQLQVSFQQSLINGVFYYLPILEKTRAAPEGYEIRVKSDRPIYPVSQGPGGVIRKGARELLFIPSHLSMIAVATQPDPASIHQNE